MDDQTKHQLQIDFKKAQERSIKAKEKADALEASKKKLTKKEIVVEFLPEKENIIEESIIKKKIVRKKKD